VWHLKEHSQLKAVRAKYIPRFAALHRQRRRLNMNENYQKDEKQTKLKINQ
jgi:hypothetical protein